MASDSPCVESETVDATFSNFASDDPTCPENGSTQDSGSTETVQQELERIESTLHQLQQQRVQVRQRINALRSSTRSLPCEILTSIFQYACQKEDGKPAKPHVPVRLGAVCSDWHKVVYSTPQLWECLRLEIYVQRFKGRSSSKAALLRLYLENVRGLPFSFELFLDPEDIEQTGRNISLEYITSLYPNPIMSVILAEAPKFKALSLSNVTKGWMYELCQSNAFTNLESLQLWHGLKTSERSKIRVVHSTGIRALCLTGFGLCLRFFCRACYDNITVIRLKNMPSGYCLGMLFHCQNVVEFRCVSPEWCHVDEAPLPTRIIVLPYLETLEWSFCTVIDDGLEYLDAPSLVSFRAISGGPFAVLEGEGALEPFFQRISKTVSNLELVYPDSQEDMPLARALLANLTNVTKLSLDGDEDASCDVVDILLSSPAGCLSPHLPKLRDLTVRGNYCGGESYSVLKLRAKLKELESRVLTISTDKYDPPYEFHLTAPIE